VDQAESPDEADSPDELVARIDREFEAERRRLAAKGLAAQRRWAPLVVPFVGLGAAAGAVMLCVVRRDPVGGIAASLISTAINLVAAIAVAKAPRTAERETPWIWRTRSGVPAFISAPAFFFAMSALMFVLLLALASGMVD